MLEQLDYFRRLGLEIDEIFTEQALHTVAHPVDAGDRLMLHSLLDHPGERGVDDGGGAAGLADHELALKRCQRDLPPSACRR